MSKFFSFLFLIATVLILAVFLFSKKESLETKEFFSDEQLKEKIGQMIMVGFNGTEVSENSEIYKIIKDVKIGGVILFDYDVFLKKYPKNIESPEQVKNLIKNLQSYSKIPLFVSVDAEGGKVNRLNPKYGFSQILSEEKIGKDKSLELAKSESKKLAEELKKAGFNMNFSPVLDLNTNPKNPIIGALGRSFSENPKTVFDNAKIFIENFREENIIAVAKHFPGHGSSISDSHLGIADVTNFYKDDELSPYKKLNEIGALDAVMAGHIVNKKIDENYPASLSFNFLNDILKRQIGFNGVIISDDMQMGAIIKEYDFEDSIIKAISAGCNVLIFSNNVSEGYDKDIAYKVRDVIFKAVKNGKIEEKKILDSYKKIMDLKAKFGVF